MSELYEFRALPQVCFNITVRNASEWIGECLLSVISQTDSNWRCIVTDDASTDNTWNIIKQYEREIPQQIQTRRESMRRWKAFNFHNALSEINNNDVIVELDGDDRLSHEFVVSELRVLHRRYDLIWTQHNANLGPFLDWHNWPSTPIPEEWTRRYPHRSAIWTKAFHPGHLRTFKRFLYNYVDVSDLQYEGKWLKCTFDAAYYTALIEITNPCYRYFYDRVCAIYNILPHNDTFIDRDLGQSCKRLSQAAMADYIKNLIGYQQIMRPHIGIILKTQASFDLFTKYYHLIERNYPEWLIYIGICKGWDTNMYLDYPGITFINLEKIIHTALTAYEITSMNNKLITCVMALYLLKNYWADSLISMPLNKFLEVVYEGRLQDLKYDLKAFRIPYRVESSDIAELRKMLQCSEYAGSPI